MCPRQEGLIFCTFVAQRFLQRVESPANRVLKLRSGVPSLPDFVCFSRLAVADGMALATGSLCERSPSMSSL